MRSWPGPTHAPPRSIHDPSSRTSVKVRPPTRSRASSSATECPACLSRNAAVRPAKPAPTTQKSTSAMIGWSACRQCRGGYLANFYVIVSKLADDPRDRPQRDRQPRRPVPRLVGGLVHRLVQLVGRQQGARVARVGTGHRGVPVAERRAVAVAPIRGRGRPAADRGRRSRSAPSAVGRRRTRTSAAPRRRPAAGESGRLRSSSGWPGSPSKSISSQRLRGAQHLPQVQVAVHALNVIVSSASLR